MSNVVEKIEDLHKIASIVQIGKSFGIFSNGWLGIEN